ncbi:hypothetical protein CMI37_38055 [Candidatus Pacearchaeota archaeon]|nr:hypothetical protein [Candidatus Pacearchaeota archaeon]|tara:strand:+ start:300 stop:962 length:663 start_codon:yes stop_codon:yes gene_type:complete
MRTRAETTFTKGLHKANLNFKKNGTWLEFGVCGGRSMMWMVKLMREYYPDSKYIGFDSWMGLPKESEGVWRPERHAEGRFSVSKDGVIKRLDGAGLVSWKKNWKGKKRAILDPRFQFIDGFYENSLTEKVQNKIDDLVFVNIDVDIHISTVQALEFLRPIFRVGVVMYFDDWKDRKDDKQKGKWGEHLAWEQFIEKYPEIKYETVFKNSNRQRCIEIQGI